MGPVAVEQLESWPAISQRRNRRPREQRAAEAAECDPAPMTPEGPKCRRAIRWLQSHPDRFNLRAGVRFGCAAALQDYLHRCRGECPPAGRAYGPLNCSERLALPPAPPAVKQAVLEAVPWAAATQHTPSKTRRLLACDPLVPVLAEVEREVEREWTRRAAWLAED